ncbi:hypothetical protein KRX57_01130 [Weeksellaceae bacterium TAE3-ERU29]|nr:hypothetical protein [Weeksellaceae bacterium TAE3-ERU29]
MKLYSILISFLLLICSSCNDSDDTCDYKLISSENKTYLCDNIQLSSSNKLEKAFIITNEKDLKDLIGSNTDCTFNIDFNKNDLILVFTPYNQDSYKLYSDCKNNHNFILDLHSKISSTEQEKFQIYLYGILINKGEITKNDNIQVSYTIGKK